MSESKHSRRATLNEATKPETQSAPVETSPTKSETPSPKQPPKLERAPKKTEAEVADDVAALFESFSDPADGAPPPAAEGGEASEHSSPEASPADTPPHDGVDENPPHDGVEEQSEASLAALAEALEVEPADLYHVEVPVADGETITIGALKDAYKNRAAAEQQLNERRDAADQRDFQQLQDQHYMANVLAALGPQITPEMARYIEDNDKRVDTEERLALGRVVPQLAGKTERTQFIEKAVKHMSRITGRSEQESAMRLGLLRGRGSAMDIKFLHEAVTAMEELERLKGVRTEAERTNPPKSKRRGGRKGVSDALTRARKRAAGGTDADVTAAVSMLINGGR